MSQVVEQDIDPEKERKSWRQLEKSALRLDKLTTDGSELVSNVVVAEDAREVQCRLEQEEARKTRSDSSLLSYIQMHKYTCTVQYMEIHVYSTLANVHVHVCTCTSCTTTQFHNSVHVCIYM